MRCRWLVTIILALVIFIISACSTQENDESFDLGISLVGIQNNYMVYTDDRYSLEVTIPYSRKLSYHFEPPDMEAAFDGGTTPDRYMKMYYAFDGDESTRNVISICAMYVPHTFDWGSDKDAIESEFDTVSGSKGKLRINEYDDSIEIHAIYNECGHYVDVYFSKEAYSEAEDLIMSVLKSVKSLD